MVVAGNNEVEESCLDAEWIVVNVGKGNECFSEDNLVDGRGQEPR